MSMERCIATLIALSFILLSPTAETAFSADKADKLTQVRMGLAARSTTSMPFFVAKERGFFREEGLDVELIVMQAIQTIQATMGNSTQFASATGSAVSAAVQRRRHQSHFGRHGPAVVRSHRPAEYHQRPTIARQENRHRRCRLFGGNSRAPDFDR